MAMALHFDPDRGSTWVDGNDLQYHRGLFRCRNCNRLCNGVYFVVQTRDPVIAWLYFHHIGLDQPWGRWSFCRYKVTDIPYWNTIVAPLVVSLDGGAPTPWQ